MIRDAGITSIPLRDLVDMSAKAREAFVKLVKHTTRAGAERAEGSR